MLLKFKCETRKFLNGVCNTATGALRKIVDNFGRELDSIFNSVLHVGQISGAEQMSINSFSEQQFVVILRLFSLLVKLSKYIEKYLDKPRGLL